MKQTLVGVIAENRRIKGNSDGASSSATPAASKPASPAPGGTPSDSTSARASKSDIAAAKSAPTELSLRISILKANPSLAALHKQTVIAGLIPDSEFWSHPARQTLLRSARQAAGQQKGRNARIVDPRFQVGKNGELKLEITEEERKDLLEQNDVLRLAWRENVPSKLDESTFWQRYFTSSLYHMIRTSSRSASLLNNSRTTPGGTSSLSSTSVKPDAIFDTYLPLVQSRYVDTLEAPDREGPAQARNRLIDLGATESDHNPTGNEKDWTMRAGAERGVLPLVRRFNEHSERVLSSSLGDSDTRAAHTKEAESAEQIPRLRKKARTEGERGVELDDLPRTQHASRYEEEIVIDDLEERRERIAMPLDLPGADGNRSAGRSRSVQTSDAANKRPNILQPRRAAIVREMKAAAAGMPANGVISLDLQTPHQKSSKGVNGMSLIEDSLRAFLVARKNRGWADLSALPEHLRKKTLDIQGSATEVLRQFWSAISASDSDGENLLKVEEGETPPPPPTPAEREAKAKRMMQILSRITPQVEELLHQTGDEQDEERISSALSTTLEACQRATGVGQLVYDKD
ncbi:unnamed protein product [Sympodiomycopsis kandeliae]